MFGVLAGPGWPKALDIEDFLSGAGRESSIFEVLAYTGRPRTPTMDDFLFGFPAGPGRPRTSNIDAFCWGPTGNRRCLGFSTIFCWGPTGNRRFLGVWQAPAQDPKHR